MITIKPADKLARIVILEFEDYLKSCEKHLESKQKLPDGSFKSYYEQIDENFLETAKDNIEKLIQERYDNDYLCKDKYEALDPSNKGSARFYQIVNVHKFHPSGSIPPGRPIISGNNSITENLSRYINHHIKHLSVKFQLILRIPQTC